MLVLKPAQRRVFAEKLPDTGNLALGAMVFAQFFGEAGFSPALALLGFALWVFFLACAAVIAED